MNVCPEDAEGSLFAKEKGFDLNTDNGKKQYIEAVLNEDILFPWIAKRMKSISQIDKVRRKQQSAYSCAYAICFYFEKPKTKQESSKSRGSSATEIYAQYIEDKGRKTQGQ